MNAIAKAVFYGMDNWTNRVNEVVTKHMPSKAGWEIIADARTYLADSMIVDGRPVQDVGDRVNAYFDLGWLQDLLMEQKGTCQLAGISDNGQDSWECGRRSQAFCQSCGIEICAEHSERVNGQTVCSGCELVK